MPVDSRYTDDIIAFMRREARPVTATEIQEGVGMSRQGAYNWIESNAWRLREVGKGRNGAAAYVLADAEDITLPTNFKPARVYQTKPRAARKAPPVTSLLTGDAADLQIGATLTVSDIRLTGGAVVVHLRTEQGGELQVTLG